MYRFVSVIELLIIYLKELFIQVYVQDYQKVIILKKIFSLNLNLHQQETGKICDESSWGH